MTDRELITLLEAATKRLGDTESELSALKSDLPGLLVERSMWERSLRRRDVVLLVMASVLCALLVVIVPLARDNAENLRILKDATSTQARAAQNRATAAAVCGIVADSRSLHGAPPPDCATTTTP